MTLSELLLWWAVVSVVTSLAMGRWIAGSGVLDELAARMRFSLDDD